MGLFEDMAYQQQQQRQWKKIKKTTKGATPSSTIEGADGRWIGLLRDCNGKNTPTKGEETEREKKLNQRFTVQDKEEEDGVKDSGSSQRKRAL